MMHVTSLLHSTQQGLTCTLKLQVSFTLTAKWPILFYVDLYQIMAFSFQLTLKNKHTLLKQEKFKFFILANHQARLSPQMSSISCVYREQGIK